MIDDQQNPWQTHSSKEIYANKWIGITEYEVTNPSGNPGIYGVINYKNRAVGVLPIDTENNIWLVGQYRYPLNAYSWEIPEGGSPFTENPVEGAARELEEETGLRAEKITKLLEMHLSNSVSDEHAVVYLAEGLSQHKAMPEDTEQIVIRKIAFNEAFQMMEDGIITDSMSVAALLKVKLLLLQRGNRL